MNNGLLHRLPDRLAAAAVLALTLTLTLAGPALAQDPLVVATVEAAAEDIQQTLSLTGEIEAHETVSVSFPTGGRVAEVLVDDGDQVRQGAVLARIDRVRQEQALRAADAALTSAQASYAQALEESERQDALFERGATTRSAMDTARDQLAAASALAAQAAAELDRARKALRDTEITAPADATVTDRSAEPGQVVGAAQPILELALGSAYDAVFHAPEAALTKSVYDRSIVIAPLERPRVTTSGSIRYVSPMVDPETGTVEVTLELDSPLPGVSYGDAVQITLHSEAESRMVLPWYAITASAEGPAVWIVDPTTSQVHLRQVEVLRYETGRVVLSGGVEQGETVVTQGAQLLFEGRVIRDVETVE